MIDQISAYLKLLVTDTVLTLCKQNDLQALYSLRADFSRVEMLFEEVEQRS